MKLEELRPGSRVFVDANIFLYHFSGVSEECSAFLERCEKGEVTSLTTAGVLLEVTHRLMMLEAVAKGLITPGDTVKKLRRNPAVISKLNLYAEQAQKIPQMNIHITPVTEEICCQAISLQRKYGLMVNDSVLVAACQAGKCRYLASNDTVFSRVERLTLLRPADV